MFLTLAILVAVLLVATGGTEPEDHRTLQERRAALVELLDRAELGPAEQAVLLAVSFHESKWNPKAHNMSAAEVKAGLAGYDRNPGRWSASRKDFSIGSGGLYGLLPATALASAKADYAPPALYVFDPRHSTVAAVGLARYILGRLDGATVATVIDAWGTPSLPSVAPVMATVHDRLRAANITDMALANATVSFPEIEQVRERLFPER